MLVIFAIFCFIRLYVERYRFEQPQCLSGDAVSRRFVMGICLGYSSVVKCVEIVKHSERHVLACCAWVVHALVSPFSIFISTPSTSCSSSSQTFRTRRTQQTYHTHLTGELHFSQVQMHESLANCLKLVSRIRFSCSGFFLSRCSLTVTLGSVHKGVWRWQWRRCWLWKPCRAHKWLPLTVITHLPHYCTYPIFSTFCRVPRQRIHYRFPKFSELCECFYSWNVHFEMDMSCCWRTNVSSQRSRHSS